MRQCIRADWSALTRWRAVVSILAVFLYLFRCLTQLSMVSVSMIAEYLLIGLAALRASALAQAGLRPRAGAQYSQSLAVS